MRPVALWPEMSSPAQSFASVTHDTLTSSSRCGGKSDAFSEPSCLILEYLPFTIHVFSTEIQILNSDRKVRVVMLW